ncbi:TIM44-like domain-containing protein [Castellaniella sp. GW247-6E4]|uniref:Tim44 domain-containing protein n=1 Tax=Castellaniella sp. GW247-6E4 TaxID=3140380 RepID=UPI00331529D8
MNLRLSRWLAGAMLMFSAVAMFAVSSDAEARRMGMGRSFGKQSTNVTQQRQAVTPPAAQTTQRSAATGTTAAAGTAAAGTAARSGMSRWLGPLAGIAAGLGIAALLSSLGLSGAFLELLSSMILIGLVAFAVVWLVRRMRGTQRTMAPAGHSYRQGPSPEAAWPGGSVAGGASRTASEGVPAAAPTIEAVASPAADPSWFIPGDFDVPTFLAQAKQRFIQIQALWDAGNRENLREYLTDDLLVEITPQLPQHDEGNQTEVVLLNAELLGIESVAGGHLASVRYSGMLREAVGAEAFRFEEVWNLYKADGQGWLLAGIQQIDTP